MLMKILSLFKMISPLCIINNNFNLDTQHSYCIFVYTKYYIVALYIHRIFKMCFSYIILCAVRIFIV